jgi:gas vesicle protein
MKISNAAFLLLTGVALGGLAGLLLAPEEGAKTRNKWLKKAKKYKKTVEDKASEYKDKAVDLKDNIQGAANDLKKRFS